MKKLITLVLGITLLYSCSTSTDSNGNTNTTVVPLTPSNLTGTIVSNNQINLSWTDNSTNETGFKIERKAGTGTFALVGTTLANVTTFNDTGLTPITTYIYRVYSYNSGGNSPNYSNEFSILTGNPTVTDIDGNTYQTVTICNQIWTKTNLNVTKYRNGDVIPQVTDPTQWGSLTTGAWCYDNNDSANGSTYGKLYNWYAVNDSRGLAPVGYHIPSNPEWTTLITCLGDSSVAGGAMKETGTAHWASPNGNATNSSGFTALPNGNRSNIGTFQSQVNIGRYVSFLSSSEDRSGVNWRVMLNYIGGNILLNIIEEQAGLPVRCIKD